MEQDVDYLVILAVHVIIMDEFQELSYLVFGNSLSCHTVVNNYRCQFKTKRGLVQHIVIHRRLEVRPQNASDGMYRTVSSAVTLQFYKEQIFIGYLYLEHFLFPERLLIENTLHNL